MIFTHGHAYWLGEDKIISFPNVLTHILFLHGFFPHYIDSIIGVEWYIGVLVMFYAITPVLFKIINNIDRAFFLVICSIILCRFLSYGTSKLLMTIFGNRNDAYLYTNIVYFSLITQFPVLTMGVLYYYITKLPAKNQTLTASYRKDKSLLAFSILFFSIALICGLMLHKVNVIFISEPVIYGLAFFLLMFSLRMQPVFIFNNKILRFLGKYSYPIYLLHFLMIYLFNKLFKSDEHTILLRLCFVLITTSLISYILQKYFDKPCYSKLKQLCS